MLVLTACGGRLEVASNAVRPGARAVGDDSVTVIRLSSDDVTRLTGEVGVEESIIRNVAPKLSMRTIGSLTLCRSLLVAGLVDRFRVVMFPVITGATGRERIYDGYPDAALDMVASRTFDGQIQLVEYVPRVLHGPPGTS